MKTVEPITELHQKWSVRISASHTLCMWLFTFSVLGLTLLGVECAEPKEQIPKIQMITTENVHGVIAPDDNNIWIVGNHGIIFHSPDEGTTWIKQESGLASVLCDGVFVDNETGWIVGTYGVILHTTDGGITWIRQKTNTDKHLFDISFVDRNYGWAVGEWNTIICTTDGGKTWDKQTEEKDRILNNVFFVDRTSGWVVGEAGTIMKTVDGGQTWEIQMPKSFERANIEELYANQRPGLFGVYFSNNATGFLCGMSGTILRTTNGGETWDEMKSQTELTLYSVFEKDETVWVVGDRGAYIVSRDQGSTWESQEDVIKTKLWLRDVYFSSPQKGWVVGMTGTVVHTKDGGKTWNFNSGLSYAMDFFEMPKALEFKNLPTWIRRE